MSRIGRLPVAIPPEAALEIDGRRVKVKGPRGELTLELPPGIEALREADSLRLSCTDDSKRTNAFHGLARSLAANILEGVTRGFKKELELQGVGFRGVVQGRKLVLNVGYSHPVSFPVPDGLEIEMQGSKILVSGPDKQQVGNVAARIRAFYPPEPYQGKGIRYVGERVRRKAGKTVA